MFEIHMLWFYVWYTNFILEIVFPSTYIMTYKAIIIYIYIYTHINNVQSTHNF